MVRLLIDLQGAQTSGSRGRGIGRYTRDLTTALAAARPGSDDIHLAWNRALVSPMDDLAIVPKRGAILTDAPYGAVARARFAADIHDVQQGINDQLLRQRIALSGSRHVLFSSLMETDEVDFVLPRHLNFAPLATSYAIVYDLIPRLFSHHYLPHESFERKYNAHLHVKTSADWLFAISERTRTDLIHELGVDPDRVVTIGAGIDLEAFQGKATPKREFLDRLGLTRAFLFFLGGDEFRKNIDGLVEAFACLPKARRLGLQVLIAGPVSAKKVAALKAMAATAHIPEDALIFGQFMTHEDLLQAYKSCVMTVVPSLYEGFGLPVLEAMANHSTVIASDNSSLSEILTDRDFLFDATRPRDIARRIEFILDHPQAAQTLNATYKSTLAGFTWKNVGTRVLETMDRVEVLDARRATASRPRQSRMESLDFVIAGPVAGPCADALRLIARDQALRVFCCEGDRAALPALPALIEDIGNIAFRGERRMPVTSFISGFERLLEHAKHVALHDHLLIIDKDAARDLVVRLDKPASPLTAKQARAQRTVEAALDRLGMAHGLWLYHEGDLRLVKGPNETLCRDSLVRALKSKVQAATPEAIFMKLETEWQRFGLANPFALAAALKDLMAGHRQAAGLARVTSVQASVARFETRRL